MIGVKGMGGAEEEYAPGPSSTVQHHRPPAAGTPCALPLPAVWPVFRCTRLPIRSACSHVEAPQDDPESDSEAHLVLPRLSYGPRSGTRTSFPAQGERHPAPGRPPLQPHAPDTAPPLTRLAGFP